MDRGDAYEIVEKDEGPAARVRGGDGPEVLTHCAAMGVAHWDEVESPPPREGRDGRDLAAARQRGGNRRPSASTASASSRASCPTPPHSHGASEELYFVLARLGARVAGRRRARGAAARLRHPSRRTRWSTPSSPGPTGSSTSSSARGTRPSSAGCRARGRSGSAGRGSRGATTIRGTSRRPSSRSPSASRRRGPRTSSTSTRSSTRCTRVAARRAPLATRERSTSRRPALGEARRGPPRVRPALPLGRGGGLRHPRRHGDARALAARGRRRGDAAARRPCRRTTAGHPRLALLPRRPGRRDDAHLRHARHERHRLVSRARTRSTGAASA